MKGEEIRTRGEKKKRSMSRDRLGSGTTSKVHACTQKLTHNQSEGGWRGSSSDPAHHWHRQVEYNEFSSTGAQFTEKANLQCSCPSDVTNLSPISIYEEQEK